MEITIREAAPLLGRSTRAVRAKIARGELPAQRRGRTWMIPLASLPLTESQRQSMQQRAELVRGSLDAVLPSRAAIDRRRARRSLLDLLPFTHGVRLLREVTTATTAGGERDLVVRTLRHALLELSVGAAEYDTRLRADALRRARAGFARVTGLLLATLEPPDARVLQWCARIEHDVLPPIGGLLRWAERRGRQ